MADIFEIRVTRSAEKDLKKLPKHVVRKLQEWADQVGLYGLQKVRKRPGYHDEPLMGRHWGKRSIRLSRSYRAIYKIDKDKFCCFVEVLEVNNHAYKK